MVEPFLERAEFLLHHHRHHHHHLHLLLFLIIIFLFFFFLLFFFPLKKLEAGKSDSLTSERIRIFCQYVPITYQEHTVNAKSWTQSFISSCHRQTVWFKNPAGDTGCFWKVLKGILFSTGTVIMPYRWTRTSKFSPGFFALYFSWNPVSFIFQILVCNYLFSSEDKQPNPVMSHIAFLLNVTAPFPITFTLILFIQGEFFRELSQVKFVTYLSLSNLTCPAHYSFLPCTIRIMIDVLHNALDFSFHALLTSYKCYLKHLRSLIICTNTFPCLLFILLVHI